MTQSCTHSREDLVLFHYDELGASARADIEQRLSSCASCREQLESLRSLEASVPRAPTVQIDDAALAAIRSATSDRIQEEALKPVSGLRLVSLPSWPRLAMGLAAAIAVFMIGRISAPDTDALFAAEGLPTADARISDIQVDQESGFVQISWEESRPVSIQAELSDARVQALRSQALLDETNPGGRLRAIKAVSQSELLRAEPDPALIEAMEGVLQTESNEGIRLQTLKALASLHASTPVSPELKETLITMLSSERNPAVRIEVLNLLTQNELASMELQDALQQARQDANPFIRSQAEAALAEMEDSRPLESME